jgi:hypothetical protein
MSRFFLTDAPALAPGVCWITKTGVGPFIDTGVDLSLQVIDRGRIYIAVDTLREMARVAGLFEEEAPTSVELRKKEFYDQGYKDALEEMNKDVISNFVERVISNPAFTASGAAVVAPESDHTAAGAAIADSASADVGTPEDGADSDKVERKGSSPRSVKRPARVSTNSSDDANFRL